MNTIATIKAMISGNPVILKPPLFFFAFI